jgi:hypothetical protein
MVLILVDKFVFKINYLIEHFSRLMINFNIHSMN